MHRQLHGFVSALHDSHQLVSECVQMQGIIIGYVLDPIYHIVSQTDMKPHDQKVHLGTKNLPFETVSTALAEMVAQSVNKRAAVHLTVQGGVQFGMVNNQIELIDKEITIQGQKDSIAKIDMQFLEIQLIMHSEQRLIRLHNTSLVFKDLEIHSNQVDFMSRIFTFSGNSSIKFMNCSLNASQSISQPYKLPTHQSEVTISLSDSRITCNSSSKSALIHNYFQNILLDNNTIKVYNGCKLLLLDGAVSLIKNTGEVLVSNNKIEGEIREILIDIKMRSTDAEKRIIIQNNQISDFYSSQPLVLCSFCPNFTLTNQSMINSTFSSLLHSTSSLKVSIRNLNLSQTNLTASLLSLYNSSKVEVIGIYAWRVSSIGCLLKVREGVSVKIEQVRVQESKVRLIDAKDLERATVMMIDIKVKNVTMERDSIMISLKDLNNATLELYDSTFESISGDFNSKFSRIQNGNLKITNCKYLNNKIPLINQEPSFVISLEARIVIQGSSLIGNSLYQESLITLKRGGNLKVSNSKFQNNTSKGRGSILLLGLNSSTNFSESVFEGNTANEGGVFFLEESVKFNSLNCTFIRNRAVIGGVMHSFNLGDGSLLFQRSSFIENSSELQGHVFYILMSKVIYLTIQGGLFMRNGGRVIFLTNQSQLDLTEPYPSYAIYLVNSKLIMNQNLTLMDQNEFLFAISDKPQEIVVAGLIINNYTLVSKNPLFKFIKQIVIVRDIQINNMQSINFLIEGSYTQISFFDCDFRDSRIKLIALSIISQVKFYSCKFMNLTMDEPILSKNQASTLDDQLSIQDVYLKQFQTLNSKTKSQRNKSLSRVFIQLVYGPHLFIHSAQVLNFNGQFIWANDAQSVVIQYSKFANITDSTQNKQQIRHQRNLGSFITGYNIHFNFENLELTDCTSVGKPIISLRQRRSSLSRFKIQIINSKFKNCITSNFERGPFEFLVFVQDITNNAFVGCKSQHGTGGALYMSCSDSIIVKSNDILEREVCIHELKQNTFLQNEAAVRGGAIFYEKNAPLNIKQNTFINNHAPFGGNYSSFPEKAAFVRIIEETKEVVPLDDEFIQTVSWSSQKPLTFTVALLENNGQVYIQNSSVTTCSIQHPAKLKFFGKTVEKMSADGLYQFQFSKIIGTRNSTARLTILCENPEREKFSIIQHPIQFQLSFNLHFPDCVDGEIRSQQECFPCKKEYYSFNNQDTQCNKCFLHAACLGSNVTFVEKGYWRESNQTTEIFLCPQKSACLQYYMLNIQGRDQFLML